MGVAASRSADASQSTTIADEITQYSSSINSDGVGTDAADKQPASASNVETYASRLDRTLTDLLAGAERQQQQQQSDEQHGTPSIRTAEALDWRTTVLLLLIVAFTAALSAVVIFCNRWFLSSPLMDLTAVLSMLLLVVSLVLGFMFLSTSYVAPLKFELVMVVIGQVQTWIAAIFFVSVVMHALEEPSLAALFADHMGPVERTGLITVLVLAGILFALFLVFYYRLSNRRFVEREILLRKVASDLVRAKKALEEETRRREQSLRKYHLVLPQHQHPQPRTPAVHQPSYPALPFRSGASVSIAAPYYGELPTAE
jgi:hypothetical protein